MKNMLCNIKYVIIMFIYILRNNKLYLILILKKNIINKISKILKIFFYNLYKSTHICKML